MNGDALVLYHYTCPHGRRGIELDGGLLRPNRRALVRAVWATDLAAPDVTGLGLTRQLITCDRTAYRYVVEQPNPFVHYPRARLGMPASWRDAIEELPGALLMHWWVCFSPVHAALDKTWRHHEHATP